MTTVTIDPITRIEGHLKVEIRVEDGVIREARCSGALYRGLEEILRGRFPLDAQRITTRICGVCPLAHSTAASLALDEALGVSPPRNGQLLRNLIFGANFLHNHLLHFYHLALSDYLPAEVLPEVLSSGTTEDRRLAQGEARMLGEHYLVALDIRRKAHELVALFGGKMPHDMAIVPGGVTHRPTLGEVAAFRFRLKEIEKFGREVYLPDLLLLARRYPDHFELGMVGNLLTFGCFPLDGGWLFPPGAILDGEYVHLDAGEIREDLSCAWYSSQPPGEEAAPDPEKAGGYSWVKAPRYRGRACEVGPAARVAVALAKGVPGLSGIAMDLLREVGALPTALSSVMGRHLARGIEALFLIQAMEGWLEELESSAPVAGRFIIPAAARGQGLTDAPRGALGHWVEIAGGRIARYQVVAPTTWNASPRDERGVPGPIEQALQGTRVRGDGVREAGRIVRSFDPCMACAIQ